MAVLAGASQRHATLVCLDRDAQLLDQVAQLLDQVMEDAHGQGRLFSLDSLPD
jgi:hypothetical protein